MPTRCRRCRAPTNRVAVGLRHEIDGRVFLGTAAARRCPACTLDEVDEETRRGFALIVASRLDRASGASLRFMRDALGLKAAEFCALIDVAVETLSRWENERRPVPRATFTVVSALVRDALEGRSTTRDTLLTLARPTARSRRIRVGKLPSTRRRTA